MPTSVPAFIGLEVFYLRLHRRENLHWNDRDPVAVDVPGVFHNLPVDVAVRNETPERLSSTRPGSGLQRRVHGVEQWVQYRHRCDSTIHSRRTVYGQCTAPRDPICLPRSNGLCSELQALDKRARVRFVNKKNTVKCATYGSFSLEGSTIHKLPTRPERSTSTKCPLPPHEPHRSVVSGRARE